MAQIWPAVSLCLAREANTKSQLELLACRYYAAQVVVLQIPECSAQSGVGHSLNYYYELIGLLFFFIIIISPWKKVTVKSGCK